MMHLGNIDSQTGRLVMESAACTLTLHRDASSPVAAQEEQQQVHVNGRASDEVLGLWTSHSYAPRVWQRLKYYFAFFAHKFYCIFTVDTDIECSLPDFDEQASCLVSTLGRDRSPESETEIDFYKGFPSNLMQELKKVNRSQMEEFETRC